MWGTCGRWSPVVGAHGATDLATRHWPPVYAVCCLTPLPSKVVTGLFVAASLVHFAEDGGPDGSIAVHSLAGLAWLVARRAASAFELMVGLPRRSCTRRRTTRAACRRRRWAALVVAAVATAVASALVWPLRTVCVNHAVQRLVIAHVVCESWVKT